jgi:hypothetical protein
VNWSTTMSTTIETKPYEMKIGQLDFSKYQYARTKALRRCIGIDDVTEIVELPVVGTVRAMSALAGEWMMHDAPIPEVTTGKDGRTTTTFWGYYSADSHAFMCIQFKTMR